jgi:hypothetical protein
MKKLERNELSFLFLWVVNPIVIVFYQNCSMSENSYASSETPPIKIEQQLQKEQPPCNTDNSPCLRFE